MTGHFKERLSIQPDSCGLDATDDGAGNLLASPYVFLTPMPIRPGVVPV